MVWAYKVVSAFGAAAWWPIVLEGPVVQPGKSTAYQWSAAFCCLSPEQVCVGVSCPAGSVHASPSKALHACTFAWEQGLLNIA